MVTRIGINGFGRVGRLAVRGMARHAELDLVHVNELRGDAATAAHLLEFDTVHGQYDGDVGVDGDTIVIDGRRVSYSGYDEPGKIPWGDLGVDVAVAEGQSLGNPLLYGGPYLGILACRESFMRRMPGRIAGQTVTDSDRRCWVLTLQTREQHIRRDKATSNICSNQGLFALRASIYLSLVGPEGIKEVATHCLNKSHYACEQLESKGWTRRSASPFFKEFVVRDPRGDISACLQTAEACGVLAGVALGQWYPHLDDCLLIAVTEKRSGQEIDRLVSALSSDGESNETNRRLDRPHLQSASQSL